MTRQRLGDSFEALENAGAGAEPGRRPPLLVTAASLVVVVGLIAADVAGGWVKSAARWVKRRQGWRTR